ncbi:uncharacterized component of anaerobic dehydrogenase [Pyrobaculum islandicum DSM 4184]|uniref:Uncharacterized component of anaerobic dehydrogenase n=1 Tax=Pyrobaculum islandicum (strain DSM 4184 / JCM 9189 / GEO3) TaxID=384616 RepID=A1RVZ7_PYRIL|nr:molecular chaperone TorD family protein [Pyrobaculum islandicum]ABL89129.1 uncharacterized component of anaerobic dehydrogenase [Pyrobaculum islandicum DSM 4184]
MRQVSSAGMYFFLGRLILKELEPSELPLVEKVAAELPEPYRSAMLGELKKEDAYLRLRVDYTKTFIQYVHPYESVFRDPSGLLCTDISSEVMRFYRKMGYEPDLREARVRCGDHLGLELAFVGILLEGGKTAEALQFLEQHLLKWGPLAGIAIRETASTPFYSAVGDLVVKFLLEDYENLR